MKYLVRATCVTWWLSACGGVSAVSLGSNEGVVAGAGGNGGSGTPTDAASPEDLRMDAATWRDGGDEHEDGMDEEDQQHQDGAEEAAEQEDDEASEDEL